MDQLQGSVQFEHVRFGYTPDKIVIHDFSETVEPGQKIAIVGPTGAGKTTMVKLLMRFYDVNSGRILIDGHDIREFERTKPVSYTHLGHGIQHPGSRASAGAGGENRRAGVPGCILPLSQCGGKCAGAY